MNKNQITNEVIISTNELVKTLTKSFKAYIENNIVNEHPAIFIKGQPGIGKSQSIHQIGKNIEKLTNKKVNIKDARLILYSPLDLNGIPVPDLENKKAVWLIPELFSFEENEDIINILFLDELTSAPDSIQAAAYQIALDKKLGDHKLPKNTFVIAAGNRIEDNSVTFEMPTALRNRFMHFSLKTDAMEWLKWAKEKDLHPEIIEFIKNNPDKLADEDFNTSSNIIITPRSYEIISNLLKNLGGSIKENELLVKSILGTNLTKLLLNGDKNKITINDIISTKYQGELTNLSLIQNLIVSLENNYNTYYNEMNKMENVIHFINKVPTDFALRFVKLVLNKAPTKYNVFDVKSFNDLMDKFKGEFNE